MATDISQHDALNLLSANERDAIEHYNAYGVPVSWFVGAKQPDGIREVIAIGEDFCWSFLLENDGETCHTSEAPLGDFSTGLEI